MFQLTVLIWLVVFFHVAAVAFIHRRVAPIHLHLRGAFAVTSSVLFFVHRFFFGNFLIRQPMVRFDFRGNLYRLAHHDSVCVVAHGLPAASSAVGSSWGHSDMLVDM